MEEYERVDCLLSTIRAVRAKVAAYNAGPATGLASCVGP
jgi:hypothetical protein